MIKSTFSETGIPVIDLSRCSIEGDRGTKEWQLLSKRVREICEENGFFEVVYDKIPTKLRGDEIFSLMRELFDLPLETKMKNFSSKNFHGYNGGIPQLPLFESLGIEDASNYDSLRRFAELMWPHGHPTFRKTCSALLEPLEELHRLIGALILDSYGLGGGTGSFMECKTLFRVMKYKAPPNGQITKGTASHTDKTLCTLLCPNSVSGLEVETRDGHWLKLALSPHSFVFMVGDLLTAWSNGRLHPTMHRVMMSGDEDRYTIGAFLLPMDETIIRPRDELVDEDHPQIFNEFGYMDYIKFSLSEAGLKTKSSDQMLAFAGK